MPAIRTRRDTTPEQEPYLLGASTPSTPNKSPSVKSALTTSPTSSATPSTPTTPSGIDTKPSLELESPSAKQGRGGTGRAWTPAERLLLFDTAVTSGASIKGFEWLIPGRSGKACYDTWKNTILPGVRRYVADAPNKGKGNKGNGKAEP